MPALATSTSSGREQVAHHEGRRRAGRCRCRRRRGSGRSWPHRRGHPGCAFDRGARDRWRCLLAGWPDGHVRHEAEGRSVSRCAVLGPGGVGGLWPSSSPTRVTRSSSWPAQVSSSVSGETWCATATRFHLDRPVFGELQGDPPRRGGSPSPVLRDASAAGRRGRARSGRPRHTVTMTATDRADSPIRGTRRGRSASPTA